MKLLIFRFLFALALKTIFSEVSAKECGTVQPIESKTTRETYVSRGAWPFLAALYHIEQSKFFCGGTLISSKHVLTAAYCIQRKYTTQKLTAEDVAVLLGAYNLDVRFDRYAQQRFVEEIYVHPDWNAFHVKYDADLAILILNDIVKFTNYIQPICMPDDNIPFGAKGSIVGWKLSENTRTLNSESIPRHTFTTLLNDSYCHTTNLFIGEFSSTRMFCSGDEGGNTLKGDSGGGFFVQSGSAWVQHGIISASISSISDQGATSNLFTIYTNINMFKNWIDEIIQNTGSEVITIGEDIMTETVIECTYEIYIEYRCTVWGSNITHPNYIVDAFTGTHISGYASQNVKEIWFWTGVLDYIPNRIGSLFHGLEKLFVGDTDRNLGLKLLKRANFRNMSLLSYLDVKFNKIETIDEDTLRDLPNLRYFYIQNNKLKILHGNLFEKNTKLTHVNANSNQLKFLHANLFENNLRLEEALFRDNKLTIIFIDFTRFRQIKKIELEGNKCIDDSLNNVNNLEEFQTSLRNCSGIR